MRPTAKAGRLAITGLFWFATVALAIAAESQPLKLWFAQPAEQWTDALPIGNGRLGAMVFGRPVDERIQFNEDTLWKGQPHDYVRAGAGDQLAELRRLLSEGKIQDAEQLARDKFLGDPVRQKAYQPFGDLRLHFPGHENATDYRRELDLDSAVVSTTYRVDEVTFHREVFASRPDQAIVMRIAADHRGSIRFTLQLDSPHTNSETHNVAHDTLALTGKVAADGLSFEARVRVVNRGGRLRADGSAITVENADAVTLFLTAATSFKNFQDISADPAKRCAADLANVSSRSYEGILAGHVADYRNLFRRVSLDLGHTDHEKLPTDQRLARVKSAGLESDPSLAALHFQYGRYLLIASSRPGGQPANLQGLWNEGLIPPSGSQWRLNINVEMNYWPAEVGNLSQCHEPLFDLIDDLVVSGARTARKQYGCRGWVVHDNTDLWRGTAPANDVDGVWPTGGAWLCQHLWEHYLFTGDKKFLSRAYPAMKEASLFFVDFLVKDPKTGWLVSAPSFSPEQGSLCIGPTMDHQLIRALMSDTIEAAAILGTDKSFAAELVSVRSKIAPDHIGKHGQLQEWLKDVDVPNNNHRHLSPLWALYPGADITRATPEFLAAAKVLLQWRGDGSTGWSYAWRMPLWARVGDGEFAFRQFNALLQQRTLPNLFALGGPYQIDGNLGAPAGVAEMLLQSHEVDVRNLKSEVRILNLLPALPKAWPTGSINGLCARGGFEVDLAWRDSELNRVVVRSKLGNSCFLRYAGREAELKTKAGGQYVFDGQLRKGP